MSDTRAALEVALARNPDDLAAHAAYADLLLEAGDPRGEFVRVQLALEDPDLPADQRASLRQLEADLLREHEVDWLGPLVSFGWREPIETTRTARPVFFKWKRGWVDFVLVYHIGAVLLVSLTACRCLRLLTSFQVQRANRDFRVVEDSRRLFEFLAGTPLRELTISDPWFDDGGVDRLIASGLLTRLRELDLTFCSITDDGADALARCPDVPRLESVRLGSNFLSPAGIATLAAVGVVVIEPQRTHPMLTDGFGPPGDALA